MSRVATNVSIALRDTAEWCRTYPAQIGRHIEDCIGVYTNTTLARL